MEGVELDEEQHELILRSVMNHHKYDLNRNLLENLIYHQDS
jgi:hypothetical protein